MLIARIVEDLMSTEQKTFEVREQWSFCNSGGRRLPSWRTSKDTAMRARKRVDDGWDTRKAGDSDRLFFAHPLRHEMGRPKVEGISARDSGSAIFTVHQ